MTEPYWKDVRELTWMLKKSINRNDVKHVLAQLTEEQIEKLNLLTSTEILIRSGGEMDDRERR